MARKKTTTTKIIGYAPLKLVRYTGNDEAYKGKLVSPEDNAVLDMSHVDDDTLLMLLRSRTLKPVTETTSEENTNGEDK